MSWGTTRGCSSIADTRLSCAPGRGAPPPLAPPASSSLPGPPPLVLAPSAPRSDQKRARARE
jgi:hypothetical protein